MRALFWSGLFLMFAAAVIGSLALLSLVIWPGRPDDDDEA